MNRYILITHFLAYNQECATYGETLAKHSPVSSEVFSAVPFERTALFLTLKNGQKSLRQVVHHLDAKKLPYILMPVPQKASSKSPEEPHWVVGNPNKTTGPSYKEFFDKSNVSFIPPLE